jgi:capsular polysaccharide biosynthesis protein
MACVSISDDPKQEIYEIENFIDDSIETVTLETLMIDNAHILNKALKTGALLFEGD